VLSNDPDDPDAYTKGIIATGIYLDEMEDIRLRVEHRTHPQENEKKSIVISRAVDGESVREGNPSVSCADVCLTARIGKRENKKPRSACT